MTKQILCERCDTEIEVDDNHEVVGDVNCISLDCPYQNGIDEDEDDIKELDFTEGC